MPSWSNQIDKNKNIVWDDTGNVVAGIGASYDGGKVNLDIHSLYNGGYKTDSDVVMRVQGNGNVGIGTTSPQKKLDVAGPIRTPGIQFPAAISVANDATVGLPYAEGFFFIYQSGNPPGYYAFGVRAGNGSTVILNQNGSFSTTVNTGSKINLYDGGSGNNYALMLQNKTGGGINARVLWLGDIQ
jgi:hypothetical protein